MADFHFTTELIDCGNVLPTYADTISIIERHGPNAHLRFGMKQRRDRGQAIDCLMVARLIVPCIMLPVIARSVMSTDGQDELASCELLRMHS
jgi:hypothetical protein